MKSLPMMDLWVVNHYQVFLRRNDGEMRKLDDSLFIYMYIYISIYFYFLFTHIYMWCLGFVLHAFTVYGMYTVYRFFIIL